MCGCFQKTTHYTLHATACLDQHLITISSPIVLHNHWLSLQPCGHPSPARRVSLSVRVCGRLLHAPAARGKTPAWSPMLSTQSSGPQVAVVISLQRGLMRHAGLWPTHVTQLTHCVAWHQITASPQTFAYAIKPACRVFWTTSIAFCRSFADLHITCMHPRTFVHARK